MSLFSKGIRDVNIPDTKKDEQYHIDMAKGIITDATDGQYELAYHVMDQNYRYYDGTQSTEAFDFLQESESGDTLPAEWFNYNDIRVKIDTLVGELDARGFEIRVRALNKDAVSSRLKKKYQMLGQINIREDLEYLQEETGIPSTSSGNLPDTAEEVEEYMNHTYKDTAEKTIESALKYLTKKYEWEYERLKLFQAVAITERCFVKCEIEDGIPKYRRVDPRHMIFDTNSKDDFLSDSTYFGEIRIMPIAEARQVFNLTTDEIETLSSSKASNIDVRHNLPGEHNIDSVLDFVTGSGNDMKVMVMYAEWQDTTPVRRKKTTDKHGNDHYQKVNEKAKGEGIISKRVKTWRKCTLIGGEIARDYGLIKNMVRSVDDIYDCNSSYTSFCHNFLNYTSTSKVSMMRGLQDAKNTLMYNLQQQINRFSGKALFFDVSKIPEGWNADDMLHNMKASGVAFYNSKKSGINDPGLPVHEIDMTFTASMGQIMAINNMYSQEMNRITGINSERQGQGVAASQAVGVTQALTTSSQFSTQSMFKGFDMFTARVMTKMAGLAKIAISHNPEAWEMVVGDSGVNFMKEEVDLMMNDYAAFIEVTPPMISDQAQLKGLIDVALQSGKIEIEDALMLMRDARNVDLATTRLQRTIEKRKKDKQQAEQEMAMQQQEAAAQQQQQMMQQQAQIKQSDEQIKGQRMTQQSEQGHRNRMREAALKERLRQESNL